MPLIFRKQASTTIQALSPTHVSRHCSLERVQSYLEIEKAGKGLALPMAMFTSNYRSRSPRKAVNHQRTGRPAATSAWRTCARGTPRYACRLGPCSGADSGAGRSGCAQRVVFPHPLRRARWCWCVDLLCPPFMRRIPRAVGRTGSGKSTLTLALLRCIFTEGDMFYDGLNTNHINLDALRSSITIIVGPFSFRRHTI
jgi:hypothetical protein